MSAQEDNTLDTDVGGEAQSEGKTKKDDNSQSVIGPPKRIPALRIRWGLSLECRPLQTKLRIADDILTFLAEAAMENEHIDKAMAAMGIAQKLKEEENVIVARRGGSTSVQAGTIIQQDCPTADQGSPLSDLELVELG